ncbi:MAG: effector binding domain-containing protein [Oscillospiraceae bacterium]|nr:effector binding domain-containing protein [Oscillospiraceae bacterium]
MELKTIRQVSLDYGISRQMLCYYEEIGLIKSSRKDDYAYRVYDENAIKQLQQIIILRKLQIPMKQIKNVLNNENAVAVIEIFRQNISELDEQIIALSVVKSILTRLVEELQEKADIHLKPDILNDKTMLNVVSSLSFSENKINNAKGNVTMETMEELNNAHETLSKLKRSDGQVRIVYVPPMTVAAHGVIGEEERKIAEKFVQERGILKIKPDVRVFAVFHCSIEDLKDLDTQSDEGWASIPDDMELPAFLTKKTFEGGLYAAYAGIENVEGFRALAEWVNASEKFEIADDGRPLFDECLDAYHLINGDLKQGTGELQGDLLIPIKRK